MLQDAYIHIYMFYNIYNKCIKYNTSTEQSTQMATFEQWHPKSHTDIVYERTWIIDLDYKDIFV